MNAVAAAEIARIAIEGASEQMSKIAKVPASTILEVVMSDPEGATAKRFREYVALGVKSGMETFSAMCTEARAKA